MKIFNLIYYGLNRQSSHTKIVKNLYTGSEVTWVLLTDIAHSVYDKLTIIIGCILTDPIPVNNLKF